MNTDVRQRLRLHRLPAQRLVRTLGAIDLWLPAVTTLVRVSGPPLSEESLPHLAAAAVTLASLPKSREANWLAATCWNGRRIPQSVTATDLRAALSEGRHQDATTICFAAHERRWWRSGPRLIDTLGQALADAPLAAQLIAESALSRERLGGVGVGELIASAVLAAIDRPSAPGEALPVTKVATGRLVDIDWYTQDAHTPLGRSALARAARVLNIPMATIEGLMWNMESIVMRPHEVRARWKAEAQAFDASAGGWGSHRGGLAMWESLREVVRREVESEVAQWLASQRS